jgi:uncharacterized protein YecE (DUF72 family)
VQTPRSFAFAVKVPRFITHVLRPRNIDGALANFVASGVLDWREKLGPLLSQLPGCDLRYGQRHRVSRGPSLLCT